MGLRPRTVVRDFYQNWWNLYTRLGGEHANEAMTIAFSPRGAREALEAGAVHPTEKGLFGADIAFDRLIDRLPIEGEGIVGRAVAGTMKMMFDVSKSGRKVSEKMLIPFSSQDGALRTWAYHWQKLHTAKFIDDITSAAAGGNKKVLQRVLDDAMPFYSQTQKTEFVRRLNGMGPEEALRYIGKQAADETNFVYHMMAQPGWMQTSWGRLAGTFHTWPMWQIELYARRLRNGTAKQRMAFMARTGAMMGAIGLLAHTTYTNLWSWMSPTSWATYAGGPAIDVAKDTHELWTQPWDRKTLAFERLAENIGRVSLPGWGFSHDVMTTIQNSRNPEHHLYTMMIGRGQKLPDHYAMQWIMNPKHELVPSTFKNLERLRDEAKQISETPELPQELRRQFDPAFTPIGYLRQAGVVPGSASQRPSSGGTPTHLPQGAPSSASPSPGQSAEQTSGPPSTPPGSAP